MRLRPPGAVSEDEFLALCIKCGQCLQVCPYHSIKLADFAKGHGIGTPYIEQESVDVMHVQQFLVY